MSLSDIRDGLKTRLETISGLKVFDTLPPHVHQLPAALIRIGAPGGEGGSYDETEDAAVTHRLTVTVLVSIAQGLGEAQDELDAYIAVTGANSIYAAVHGDPSLNAKADSAAVAGYRNYDGREYPPGSGEEFLGVDFEIEVFE